MVCFKVHQMAGLTWLTLEAAGRSRMNHTKNRRRADLSCIAALKIILQFYMEMLQHAPTCSNPPCLTWRAPQPCGSEAVRSRSNRWRVESCKESLELRSLDRWSQSEWIWWWFDFSLNSSSYPGWWPHLILIDPNWCQLIPMSQWNWSELL